ncbi:D-aminoacyl-tRNA deacylase [Anaerocolumna xylanovorans]|uniref:D-aminoacyl-tRNA deacylase n=1 Tax=Anaerocolumna xylanovorans DSM 12503 TaxID=1121345 RepID=A0A1M7Y9U5_9FIRM|nr:D-aminoacyl-tRNA deacylase [Anaerocolumna xylanovorans]SHO49415.1 D-tyrosyl-tRNA(Tyr) deacylase [Anaerocolumna xylanovorans DSM 12503]
MKVVIQRVKHASVTIEEKIKGSINRGFLLLIGIGKEDTRETVDKYLDKILKLRIFDDEEGKTNLSLNDINGDIMAISQFTLYADCRKGNRPNFLNAAGPKEAKELYEYFLKSCKEKYGRVESGEFGADMKIDLLNDGPFTVVLDKEMLGY